MEVHLVLDRLQSQDITQSFCVQHNISSESANHCTELSKSCSSKQEGEILLHIFFL